MIAIIFKVLKINSNNVKFDVGICIGADIPLRKVSITIINDKISINLDLKH